MPNLIKQALSLITGAPVTNTRPLKGMTERELIELESEIGRHLFGPIPHGHRREFFCLDKSTWIWYEEWKDDDGKPQSSTTRYEIQSSGVLKAQDGHSYRYIEGEELRNLTLAARLYFEQTMRQIYKRDPDTGRLLKETPPATIEV